jgi:hypothetical protein
VAALVAVMILADTLYIGVLASPPEIAEYHFGAEAMLAHGGPAYATAEAYVRHGMMTGGLAAGLALIAAFVASRATRSGGKLQVTWALRAPGYAWLIIAVLLLGLALVTALDPVVILEGEAASMIRTTFWRLSMLWLVIGTVAAGLGWVRFRSYDRFLRQG